MYRTRRVSDNTTALQVFQKSPHALKAWQIRHERGKLSPLLNGPTINVFTDYITQLLRL
jgi:hypothetical protein